MARALMRRLAGIALTVLAVAFLVVAALTAAPGDAAEALLGEGASPEQLAGVRSQLRLDAPLHERYAGYVTGALTRGDLGRSMASGRPVGELLRERLPATLLLAGAAVALTAALGVTLGLIAAARRESRLDHAIVAGSALGLALPPYWVALLLVLAFSVRLRWLPVFGSGTPAHLVLPAVTLALPAIAAVARLVRAGALEVMRADYVRTARAKGLSEPAVLRRHVLPNSVIPALTLLGLQLSHLIGGTFVVETIFAWPGLGRLTVQAVFDRDIPVLMGAALVVAPLALLVGLAVDVLHGVLDPRVRHGAI